jgi:hypothetical protein
MANHATPPPDPSVAEAISSLSHELIEAIHQLSTTLSSLGTPPESETLTKFVFAAFVAVIGAFSAYLFNFFHWKMIERKRRLSLISGALTSIVEDLESMAVLYWVKDYKEEDKEEICATEVVLKSKIFLINHLIRVVLPSLDTNRHYSTIGSLKDFQAKIFDLVTGDDFESRNRKASKVKAMRISRHCSDIRAKIASLESHV